MPYTLEGKIMEIDNLNRILATTHQRGDKQWATPAGAILDVLRDLIKAGQISDVSHACRLYSTAHPQARHFVASCLPELIVNNYKPIGETVDFPEFIAWSEENPEWSNKISSNAMSLRLEGIIKGMVENLRESKNPPKLRAGSTAL
jgi:hypothetical protein